MLWGAQIQKNRQTLPYISLAQQGPCIYELADGSSQIYRLLNISKRHQEATLQICT